MFGYDGHNGILGLNPNSGIWDGFIDPVTKKARLSIFDKNGSITLGSADPSSNQGTASLKTHASLPDFTYPVSSFSFGIVYQTNVTNINGQTSTVDSSWYFEDILQSN